MRAYNLFRQSQDLIARRNIQGILRTLNQALEIEPRNPSIFVQLGVISFLDNNYDKGIEYFNRALDIDSNQMKALEMLMEHYTKEGEPGKVQVYFDKLKAVRFVYSDVLVKRGDILFNKQKPHQAVEQWKKALIFTPRDREIISRINEIAEQDFMDKLLNKFDTIDKAKEFYKRKSEEGPDDKFAKKMVLWAERRSLGLDY